MLAPRIFTDSIFDDFFNDFNDIDKRLYGKHANREMLTDIKEHDDRYDVEIDLPGFKKDEIKVGLENGYLTISAAKGFNKEDENKEGKLIRQEKYYGTMQRSFYVGDNIMREDIKAKYEDGVLTLSVPKKEKPKQIESKYIAIE